VLAWEVAVSWVTPCGRAGTSACRRASACWLRAPRQAPHSSIVEELRADARQRRRLTAWRLIGVNVLVLLLNALVAARGVYLWSVLQRLRVVEWIMRLRPHVQPTFHAMRVINWVTLPVRWPLRRLGARRAAAAARLRT
jgi:hypothetical protein